MVVDPVLVSTSGDELAGPAILDALRYGVKLSFLGECVCKGRLLKAWFNCWNLHCKSDLLWYKTDVPYRLERPPGLVLEQQVSHATFSGRELVIGRSLTWVDDE